MESSVTVDKRRAAGAAVIEFAIQLADQVPLLSSIIEAARKYQENIDEQQFNAFLASLVKRVDELDKKANWFGSPEAQAFVKKIVATALNAEYSDKLEFLVNALLNGPSLGNDEARRIKFVELIRQASRPALEVLVASVRLEHDGAILTDRIAADLRWHPELVEACVSELHSFGAYSHILKWQSSGNGYRAAASYMNRTPGIAPFTREFAKFIGNASAHP